MLGGIEKKDQLISPTVIEPIQTLKCDYLGNRYPRLHSDEVLVALSICAVHRPKGSILAMRQLSVAGGTGGAFHGHLPQVDEGIFRRLKVNLTCDPSIKAIISTTSNRNRTDLWKGGVSWIQVYLVTGGVVSSLGKGITAASLGRAAEVPGTARMHSEV